MPASSTTRGKAAVVPGTEHCHVALQQQRLATIALPLSRRVATADDPDLLAFLSRTRLPPARVRHRHVDLVKLRDEIQKEGFHAGVNPPIAVAPAPAAILLPEQLADQDRALEKLARENADDLVRLDDDDLVDLRLQILDGRARCRVLYDMAGVEMLPSRTGDKQPQKKRERTAPPGSSVLQGSFPVLLLKRSVWDEPLVLKMLMVDSPWANTLLSIPHKPSLGASILQYGGHRYFDLAARPPGDRNDVVTFKRIFGTRGTTEAIVDFIKSESSLATLFCYAKIPTLRRLFGEAAPGSAQILLFGAAETSNFFIMVSDCLDVPLSVAALSVLSKAGGAVGFSNPLFRLDGGDGDLATEAARRGRLLADALDARFAALRKPDGTPYRRRLEDPRHGVGRYDQPRQPGPLEAGTRALPALEVDVVKAVQELDRLACALREGAWAQHVTAKDIASFEKLVLPDFVNEFVLLPPTVKSSGLGAVRAASALTGDFIFFDQFLLKRVVDGLSLLALGRREQLGDKSHIGTTATASLEGVLVVLLDPKNGRKYCSATFSGSWNIPEWIVDLSESLLKHLWLHRDALIASFAILETAFPSSSTDLFGDTTWPSLLPDDPPRRARSIWSTAPGLHVLEVLAEETARLAPVGFFDDVGTDDEVERDSPSPSRRTTVSPLVDFAAAVEAWRERDENGLGGGIDEEPAREATASAEQVESTARLVREKLDGGGGQNSLEAAVTECARRAVERVRRGDGDEGASSGSAQAAAAATDGGGGHARDAGSSPPAATPGAGDDEDEDGPGGGAGGTPSSSRAAAGDARAGTSPSAESATATSALLGDLDERLRAATEVQAHLAIVRRAHALPVQLLCAHFAQTAVASFLAECHELAEEGEDLEGLLPAATSSGYGRSSINDLAQPLRTSLGAAIQDRPWLEHAIDDFFIKQAPLGLEEYARLVSPFDLALDALVTSAMETRVMLLFFFVVDGARLAGPPRPLALSRSVDSSMPSLECTVGLLNRCYVASTSRVDSTRHDKDSASSTRFSVMVFFSGVYTFDFLATTEGAAGFLLARVHD
ncbi:hypothetical protein JCM9279_002273 [Rhodotorula babjevae]